MPHALRQDHGVGLLLAYIPMKRRIRRFGHTVEILSRLRIGVGRLDDGGGDGGQRSDVADVFASSTCNQAIDELEVTQDLRTSDGVSLALGGVLRRRKRRRRMMAYGEFVIAQQRVCKRDRDDALQHVVHKVVPNEGEQQIL